MSKTAYGAAVGCFCEPGAGRGGNAQNCLRCSDKLFLGRGLAEQETLKTAYGAAVGCFCGPGAGLAGNAQKLLTVLRQVAFGDLGPAKPGTGSTRSKQETRKISSVLH